MSTSLTLTWRILLLVLGLVSVSVPQTHAAEQIRMNITHVHKGLPTSEKLHRGAESSQKRSAYWQARHNGRNPLTSTQSGYMMDLWMGTPAKPFRVQMDTGSDQVWLKCGPCSECPQNEGSCAPCPENVLYPWQSSSFSSLGCNPYYGCGPLSGASCTPRPNPFLRNRPEYSCSYVYQYFDTSYTKGAYATEAIALPGSPPAKITFGCSNTLVGRFDGDGIAGLNSGPLSLVSQLPIDGVFSYCLAPYGQDADSALFFGAPPPNPLASSTPILGKGIYYVHLHSVSVGNQMIVNRNQPYSDLNSHGTMIDSGTTLTILEEGVFNDVAHAFVNAMPYVPQVHVPGHDLCFDVSRAPNVRVPPLTFHFEGASFSPPVSNYMGMVNPNVMCLLMSRAILQEGDLSPVGIIGNIMQQNYLVTYDTRAMKISFVPADCSNY